MSPKYYFIHALVHTINQRVKILGRQTRSPWLKKMKVLGWQTLSLWSKIKKNCKKWLTCLTVPMKGTDRATEEIESRSPSKYIQELKIWQRTGFFIWKSWDDRPSIWKKSKLNPYFTPYIRVISKWIQRKECCFYKHMEDHRSKYSSIPLCRKSS